MMLNALGNFFDFWSGYRVLRPALGYELRWMNAVMKFDQDFSVSSQVIVGKFSGQYLK